MRTSKLASAVLLLVLAGAMLATAGCDGSWTESDDSLPGATLGLSPITGSVDTTSDARDCYSAMLSAGQRVRATLTWEGGADLDLALYGADVTDFASPTVAASSNGTHREAIDYTAAAGSGGVYGIAVTAVSESATYTLDWSIPPLKPDDEVPGLALTDASVTGTLGLTGDIFDVYRVHADPGQRISARAVSVPPTGTITIAIAGPGLQTVQQIWSLSNDVLRAGLGEDSPNTLYYGVPTGAAGDYYVIMMATSKVSYSYTLDASASVNPGLPCTLTLQGPSTSAYNAAVTLTGSLDEQGRWGMASMPVAIYANGRYKRTVNTDDAGEFSCVVRAPSRTVYQARFASQTASEVAYVAADSAKVVVKPASLVGVPVVPRGVQTGSAFTVSGTLRPRHAAGTYPVQVRCYRLDHGKWVLGKTVRARVSDYSSYSRYTARVALPKKGRWRISALAPADAGHARASTAPRSLIVE